MFADPAPQPRRLIQVPATIRNRKAVGRRRIIVLLAALMLPGAWLLPVASAATPNPPQAAAVPAEIQSFTLANGLKIIVWPDHDIPNVVMYNFVRAGGRNEYPGITGLSHFFEHMMFNGTSKRAPGEFDRIMEAAGGANNAYTSNDVTVYQDWFPRSALRTIFDLEADRLENLAFDPEVVNSERDVVFSERRTRVDNDNTGRLYEQLVATAYIAHPYQFPVIGWPSDIEAWTIDDLESYFTTYYAPNNCTMVFVGDVSADEVLALAKEFLERIPAQTPPASIRTVEPEQQGMRRVRVEAPAQTPLLHLAFHVGAAGGDDALALELLLKVLVGGDSSRLHRVLVEDEQLAVSVGGFQSEGFDPGLAYFYLTLPPAADVGAVEARIMALFAELAEHGVSEAELNKARNIMLADFWRGLATINGKAAALGKFEVFHGGYETLFGLSDAIEKVNRDQLRAVARQYFKPQNVTIGVLEPPVAAMPEAAQ